MYLKIDLARAKEREEFANLESAQLKVKLKESERSRIIGSNERIVMLEESIVNLNDQLEQTVLMAV